VGLVKKRPKNKVFLGISLLTKSRFEYYNLGMIKNKTNPKIIVSLFFLSFSLNAGAQNTDIFGNMPDKTFGDFLADVKSSPVDTKEIQASTESSVSNDLIHFWDELKSDVFDNICKSAEIDLKEKAELPDVGGLEGKFKRYMKQFPDKRIALIDEIGVKLDASLGQEVLQIPDFGPLNVGIGAAVEGKSIVVRPLGSVKYCKELDTLIDLRKIKTILPMSGKRIKNMAKGEIWKMPITTRFSFSTGVGAPVATYVMVSVGAGVTKERRPSITLYRMDEEKLRLRIRIDRLTVKSVSGGVSSTFSLDGGDIGLFQAENILTKEINRAIAREINRYLAAKITYGHSKSKGKKILLEFIVNPKDDKQIEALEEFLKGDYTVIKRFIQLGLKFDEFAETANSVDGMEAMQTVVEEAGDAVGVDPIFAGANHYHGHSDNFNINLPIIHSHENAKTDSYNRYQTVQSENGVMHVNQAGKTSNGSSINLPFVGTMIKYNSDKNVYVINKEDADNQASNPTLLFQHNVGFVRQGEDTARNILTRMNNVLKYASTDGDGTVSDMILPVDQIFPSSPVPEDYDPFGDQTLPSKTYKASVVSFKLMFSKEGVQEILFSPAERILKAYLNVMRESESAIVSKAGHLFGMNEKGVVQFDRSKAAKILGVDQFSNDDNGINPLDIMRDMAYTATCIIKDIFSVRNESDWKKQAERLSRIGAGRGKSKMGFEDFFKVAIQLVSRPNISAEVYVHTDKRVKGEEDVTQTYSHHASKDNNFNTTISEVNAMRERFAEPSTLSD